MMACAGVRAGSGVCTDVLTITAGYHLRLPDVLYEVDELLLAVLAFFKASSSFFSALLSLVANWAPTPWRRSAVLF